MKRLVQKPKITRKMSRWALLLSEYDISLVMSTMVKSQALADLLAICSGRKEDGIREEIPRDMGQVNICENGLEWTLMFDRTPSKLQGGVRVVFTDTRDGCFLSCLSLNSLALTTRLNTRPSS